MLLRHSISRSNWIRSSDINNPDILVFEGGIRDVSHRNDGTYGIMFVTSKRTILIAG